MVKLREGLCRDHAGRRGSSEGGAAGRTVRSCATRWRVPTLLLWAGADRCVAPAGSAAFAAAAPPGVVTAQAFPKLYHEMFNEPEREQVLGHLSRWLARFESPPDNPESLP